MAWQFKVYNHWLTHMGQLETARSVWLDHSQGRCHTDLWWENMSVGAKYKGDMYRQAGTSRPYHKGTNLYVGLEQWFRPRWLSGQREGLLCCIANPYTWGISIKYIYMGGNTKSSQLIYIYL